MNTLLVPNAGNTIERVKYIATVIKSNARDSRAAASEVELLRLKRMMEAPLTTEALQLRQIRDANICVHGKLCMIWLHRQRST